MRAERMAWAGRPCRRGQRPLSEVVSAPPSRPIVPAAGDILDPPRLRPSRPAGDIL